MYVSLNKKFLDSNLEKMNQLSIEEIGEDGKDKYLFIDWNIDGKIEDWDENEKSFLINAQSELGYISLDVKFDEDDIIKMIEMSVKKMNKFKTILEGLK